jgi:hypothetical protein
MSKRSKHSDKGRYVPGNPLERMQARLVQEMRDSGLTVTEIEVSGTEPYEVSFPPARVRPVKPQPK